MISAGRTTGFTAVRVVGGLLPPDVLSAVVDGTADGLAPADFHLGGERPREAAARTWNHLTGVYARFRADLARLREGDPAVGVTRERWLSQLLTALDYGRVPPTAPGGLVIADRPFPISHLWGSTPIHLLGWGVPLDRRTPGVPGAATRAPQAMLQELLNRSENYAWAILSNGRFLRLLRDSTTLTGQAYLEFDLESIFDGDLYADWALLYLLAHQSRVEVEATAESAAPCWLERWRTTAVSQGVRALELLRGGVQSALQALGTGFLQHPANVRLRDGLESGAVRLEDLHASLLRTIYRLIFWSVAEDREALLDPAAPPAVADRYRKHFSSARLRRLARARHGSAHSDLWLSASLVLTALSRPGGEPRLGLPGLGGLFATDEADVLTGASLDNATLLSAIRSLSIVQPRGQAPRTVDFRNLGAEELGSIYESLLELVPRRDPVDQTFSLEQAAGNDRKTTGSYYTPTDLVELVLDTALDPVLDDAEKQPDPEAALLAVTVCDPAIGSGHFMVAAARRIASRLAVVRTGEVDPTPTMLSDAVHDVVAQCIYGVDVNPMAASLAKVSLWLEAMAPGRPLSFLDHHIKVGNALLGTTPALLAAGIPDAAYVALTGDDKAVAREWRSRNAAQREYFGGLLDESIVTVDNSAALIGTREVAARSSGSATLADTAWAAQRYATLQASDLVVRSRRVADAWCAAFLTPKVPDVPPITMDSLQALSDGTAADEVIQAVEAVAARHRLFHWHLEFPEIFRVPEAGPANTSGGWTGGFSAMLGNPPWERVKLQEQEFFAARDPAIAGAASAAIRRKRIKDLVTENRGLAHEFAQAKRRSEAESQFLRSSGRFPLCGIGDVNTYSVFAEHFRASLAESGRSGVITPTGLATDATTASFFSDNVRSSRLAAFYDFENRSAIFWNVHRQFRFAISCLTGGERVKDVRLSFLNNRVADAVPRQFELESAEVAMLNPNTGTLPLFGSRRDADITLACYRQHSVLIRDGDLSGNPWGLRFHTLFHMTNDSHLFHTAESLQAEGSRFDGWAWHLGTKSWLPLYEAKMIYHWNSRFATYMGATQEERNAGSLPRIGTAALDDPDREPFARYWISESDARSAIVKIWNRRWLFGWRDITNSGNERTVICAPIPASAVSNKYPVASIATPALGFLLQTVWSSFIFDYLARQKQSGSSLNFYLMKQLSCPTPQAFADTPAWLAESYASFLRPRVLELSYTSHRMEPYADEIQGGDAGEPFRWLPERRAQLVAELDSAMLHLYGLDRDDTEHVLDSFPIVRRHDERDYGEFRTKRLVLTAYDAMAEAAQTGVPFRSPLNPLPGDGPRHERRST